MRMQLRGRSLSSDPIRTRSPIKGIPALAISAVYCLWNLHRLWLQRRDHVLRERVTYMLWVCANQIDRAPAEAD